jgi:hypothetical protein
MMKKLLVLVLILAFASAASAYSVWLEVDPLDVETSYLPSEIITINLVSDLHMSSFSFCVSATGGTVVGTGIENPAGHDAGTIHPLFDLMPDNGLVVNSGGALFTGAKASIFTMMDPPAPALTVMYSFEFHVPEVEASTDITIYDVAYKNYTGFIDGELTQPLAFTDATDAVIHVTPEPMTIALLGIGGLFLRRRK